MVHSMLSIGTLGQAYTVTVFIVSCSFQQGMLTL